MRTSNAPHSATSKGPRRATRLIAAAATLGVVACGQLVTGAGIAVAGTNGQQINYYNHDSYGQCTTGKNQEGKNKTNCTSFTVQGSNKDEGYWWVGPVKITWYKNGNRGTVQSTCNVPKNQNGDFFNCYEP